MAERNFNKEMLAPPPSCVDGFLKKARRSTPAGWSWVELHLHRIYLLHLLLGIVWEAVQAGIFVWVRNFKVTLC